MPLVAILLIQNKKGEDNKVTMLAREMRLKLMTMMTMTPKLEMTRKESRGLLMPCPITMSKEWIQLPKRKMTQ